MNRICDLSIIIPGIRPEKWYNVYKSIKNNCERYLFEVIFVGPSLPKQEGIMPYAKFIQDFGSPSRCMNIGANHAQGKYITWSADDGIHINKGFDRALDILTTYRDKRDIVVAKYTEGEDKDYPDSYYEISTHYKQLPFVHPKWLHVNLAFMETNYYKYIGGCNSLFDTSAVTLTDLAIRCQRYGSHVNLLCKSTAHFSLTPTDTGDHGPVYYSQYYRDMPLFYDIHRNPKYKDMILVDYDNWKRSPEVWKPRFK
jgi:hypothetical protein